MSHRAIGTSAAVVVLAGALAACGKGGAATDVTSAPGAPVVAEAPRTLAAVVTADPTKTGEAYAEELEHNPDLFEKQKEICHGNGPSFQPSPELQAPCAAWDIARRNLEVDQGAREGGVKNTNSL
jgi:hypothetical protein